MVVLQLLSPYLKRLSRFAGHVRKLLQQNYWVVRSALLCDVTVSGSIGSILAENYYWRNGHYDLKPDSSAEILKFLTLAVQLLGREAGHSPRSNAEVKSAYMPSWRGA
jgi:hypothetical protein